MGTMMLPLGHGSVRQRTGKDFGLPRNVKTSNALRGLSITDCLGKAATKIPHCHHHFIGDDNPGKTESALLTETNANRRPLWKHASQSPLISSKRNYSLPTARRPLPICIFCAFRAENPLPPTQHSPRDQPSSQFLATLQGCLISGFGREVLIHAPNTKTCY